MLRSWIHTHGDIPQKLIIVENSTNDDTREILAENNIDYILNEGGTHGSSVNIAIDKCDTDYALLVDTDVIFKQSHEELFKLFEQNELTLMGKVEGDRGGKHIRNRVNPWHCFINVKHLKENNISFFDEDKFKVALKSDYIYDVGSTMFEDVHSKKMKIADMDFHNKHYIHFEGLSWYTNKYDSSKQDTHSIDFDPNGSHNNKMLYDAGIQKHNLYESYTEYLQTINILNKFTQPKMLIKFPTRDRPDKFIHTLDVYHDLLSGRNDVHFLISCDTDDSSMNNPEMINLINTYDNTTIKFSDNKTKIEAINIGLEDVQFDIVLLASDDMIPEAEGYDQIIIQDMLTHYPDYDGVLWYNDGTQANRLNTLCILGRTYYDRFNYIYNPEYSSLWSDAEFTEVSIILNKVYYSDRCIIRHMHHSVCDEGADQLYARNELYESDDRAIFLMRKSKGYMIDDS